MHCKVISNLFFLYSRSQDDLNVGNSYYTELFFLLTMLMSKFSLVRTTYVMWEYYLINYICLVHDSPPVMNSNIGYIHTQHPYSGVGFFSVSLLTVWTKQGQSAYLGFSF